MEKTLDQKIAEAIQRAAYLKGRIAELEKDAQMTAYAYQVALSKGDSAGADTNREANNRINYELKALKTELEQLERPETGTLALLNIQKQNQLAAQQALIAQATAAAKETEANAAAPKLTPEQQYQLQLAQITSAGSQKSMLATTEAEKEAEAAKTRKMYIIGGIVLTVIVVLGIVIYKVTRK
jgi:hypothetical protein